MFFCLFFNKKSTFLFPCRRFFRTDILWKNLRFTVNFRHQTCTINKLSSFLLEEKYERYNTAPQSIWWSRSNWNMFLVWFLVDDCSFFRPLRCFVWFIFEYHFKKLYCTWSVVVILHILPLTTHSVSAKLWYQTQPQKRWKEKENHRRKGKNHFLMSTKSLFDCLFAFIPFLQDFYSSSFISVSSFFL